MRKNKFTISNTMSSTLRENCKPSSLNQVQDQLAQI